MFYKIYFDLYDKLTWERWPGKNEEEAIKAFLDDAAYEGMTRDRIKKVEVYEEN